MEETLNEESVEAEDGTNKLFNRREQKMYGKKELVVK